ncbi:hemogen isoform X1 [Anas acuta]|uniref:hemogen isoform X1 n=2 Tax=Anas acuta TaxID=28680 RepID=UPI0035C8EDD0
MESLGATTRRGLRDREMLRKRKEEAQEKDSVQWALGEQEKIKRPRRGAGRGRRRRSEVKPEPEAVLKSELEPDREPLAHKEAVLMPTVPAHQDQPPMVGTIQQETPDEVQMGALEGNVACGSQAALSDLPSGSQIPLGNLPSGSQIPPSDLPSGSKCPPGDLPSGSKSPPGDLPSENQSPLLDLPSGSQSPLLYLPSGSQSPLGEEEMLKLAEMIPEDVNTPVEDDKAGSFPSVLY